MKKITIFLSVLLSVFILTGCGGKKEKLEWPTDGIAKLLPKPDAKYGKVTTNDEERFSARIEKQSKEDFKKYVKLAEKNGFNIDKKVITDESLTLYNKNGDKLHLVFWDKNFFDIDLYKSIVTEKYTWPSIGLSALILKPDSDYGKIDTDSEKHFSIYVGKTSKEAFEKYINKVIEKGFTINHSKSDNNFRAEDPSGNKIDIYYDAFKTMRISISAPEKQATTTQSSTQPEQTESSQQPTQQTSTTGVRPEVKEQIDAYEKFFDEYIAFMTKYKDSNNAVSMAADYANFMKKYTDYMTKFENIDDKGWNDAEVAYWLEVNGRVMGKLATIQ